MSLKKYILKEIKMFLIDGCDEISTIFIDSFYSKLFIQVLHNFKESSKCQELTVKLINTLFDVFGFCIPDAVVLSSSGSVTVSHFLFSPLPKYIKNR